MKVFFDTEFDEDGETIRPISLGFVTEAGHRLYVVISDADWDRCNDWVKENVLPYVHWNEGPTLDDWDMARDLYIVVPRADAGRYIEQWISEVCPIDVEKSPFPEVEFWADYADYDWIVLCQLYGTMLQRPGYWPMFAMDIQQKKREVGYTDALPEPEGQAHCAIDDAINCKERWEILDARWWDTVGRALPLLEARGIAPSTDSDLLPSAFWGPGGEFVVLKDPMDVYGPFHSDDVAHVWSQDMGFHPSEAMVLTIKAPPKAPRHRTGGRA